MGSSLGPILAGISMVELERTVLPTLREHMSPWKRYVDDTISYIKEESIEHVLSKLNGYHDNIEFTYEIEYNGKLPLLDVLLIYKDCKVEITVYRKLPTMIYIHIFTGSCFPQQHGNDGRYRHKFQESLECALTTNTWKIKLNTSRKYLETSMTIQIG